MMSKKEKVIVEDDELETQIDLTTLLAHSQQLDQNIAEAEHEANRQAAMADFGLVEPGAAKSTKVPKVDAKLADEIATLKEQLAESQQANQLKDQQIVDLKELLTERDEQIARLGAELEHKEDADVDTSADDTGTTKEIPKVPVKETVKENPFKKE